MPEDLNGMRYILMDVRHVTMSNENHSPNSDEWNGEDKP